MPHFRLFRSLRSITRKILCNLTIRRWEYSSLTRSWSDKPYRTGLRAHGVYFTICRTRLSVSIIITSFEFGGYFFCFLHRWSTFLNHLWIFQLFFLYYLTFQLLFLIRFVTIRNSVCACINAIGIAKMRIFLGQISELVFCFLRNGFWVRVWSLTCRA